MKVKKAYQRQTHKYGIRVLMSLKEVLRFNEESGTTFWWEAIKKELKNARVAFKLLDDDKVGTHKFPAT